MPTVTLNGAAYGSTVGVAETLADPGAGWSLSARLGEPVGGATPLRRGLGRLAASWRGGPIATSTVCGTKPYEIARTE